MVGETRRERGNADFQVSKAVGVISSNSARDHCFCTVKGGAGNHHFSRDIGPDRDRARSDSDGLFPFKVRMYEILGELANLLFQPTRPR